MFIQLFVEYSDMTGSFHLKDLWFQKNTLNPPLLIEVQCRIYL
jgi:hypothetical protein